MDIPKNEILGTIKASDDIKNRNDGELYDWQKEAINELKGKDSILIAPTGAGKTKVYLEWAQVNDENSGRTFITAPIKALSNERYAELKKMGYDVGINTGDTKVNTDAKIICCTQESYTNDYTDEKNANVVVDEFHYIMSENGRERADAYIEGIQKTDPSSRIMILTATLGDKNQAKEYLDRVSGRNFDTYETFSRATDLVYTSHEFKDEEIKDTLIFSPTYRNVNAIAENLYYARNDKAVSPEVKNVVDSICKSIGTNEYREEWYKGIGRYTGKMIPSAKHAVEEMYKAGIIDTVVGTDALAIGVNLPCETVLFDGLEKGTWEPLTQADFEQKAGRAGRIKYFSKGYVGLYDGDRHNFKSYVNRAISHTVSHQPFSLNVNVNEKTLVRESIGQMLNNTDEFKDYTDEDVKTMLIDNQSEDNSLVQFCNKIAIMWAIEKAGGYFDESESDYTPGELFSTLMDNYETMIEPDEADIQKLRDNLRDSADRLLGIKEPLSGDINHVSDEAVDAAVCHSLLDRDGFADDKAYKAYRRERGYSPDSITRQAVHDGLSEKGARFMRQLSFLVCDDISQDISGYGDMLPQGGITSPVSGMTKEELVSNAYELAKETTVYTEQLDNIKRKGFIIYNDRINNVINSIADRITNVSTSVDVGDISYYDLRETVCDICGEIGVNSVKDLRDPAKRDKLAFLSRQYTPELTVDQNIEWCKTVMCDKEHTDKHGCPYSLFEDAAQANDIRTMTLAYNFYNKLPDDFKRMYDSSLHSVNIKEAMELTLAKLGVIVGETDVNVVNDKIDACIEEYQKEKTVTTDKQKEWGSKDSWGKEEAVTIGDDTD